MFFILQYTAIAIIPLKLVSPFSLNSLSASDLGQQIGFEQPKQLSGPRIVSLQELEEQNRRAEACGEPLAGDKVRCHGATSLAGCHVGFASSAAS